MKEIIIRLITDDKFYNNFTDGKDYWDNKPIEVYVDGKKIEYLEHFSVDFNTTDNNIKYTATLNMENYPYPDGFVKDYWKNDGE